MVAVFAEVQMFAAFPYIILFQVSLGVKVILLICRPHQWLLFSPFHESNEL
jgi:hypothetical protein